MRIGVLFALCWAGATVAADDLDATLAALVDLPTPKERAAQARELAKNKDRTLDMWLAATRRFAPKAEPPPKTGSVSAVAALPTGRVDVQLSVPARYRHDRPTPLLLALHGTGGDGTNETARWRSIADDLGFIVCAPTDSGANKGYTFMPGERAEALAVLRWVRRRYNIDENRIHLTGVSRGGHLTWDLGTRQPDRWASLAPMIGGPRLDLSRGQNNLRYLENIAHLPIRDLQGEGDDKRLLFNLRYAFALLQKHGARDAELVTFPALGHSFRFEAVAWPTFLGTTRRDPVPSRVVRLTARASEGRAYWVEIRQTKRPVKEVFVPQVRADEWARLDDAGKRRFMAEAALARTARLEVEMTGPGEFNAKSTGVARFRLLLTTAMFDPRTAVSLRWQGRARSKRVRLSTRVLLSEFAERFDRTFLPVGELSIP